VSSPQDFLNVHRTEGSTMISAAAVELRAGSHLLLDAATFRVAPGDRIGLVGRNGAGKTTLTKALAGQTLPAAGTITRSGDVGYLPQDPRTGDLDVTARDRILSARGLDQIVRDLRAAETSMAAETGEKQERAMRRYARLDAEFTAAGGYAAESEAAQIAGALGLTERQLDQALGTLSGGQRRRIELARILFSGAQTLLLDEPTNHLDADSIAWLRDHLKGYKGGLIVISHDVDLLDAVVNKVFHLDANRAELDIYNLGWKAYLGQRETDERRRKRERANAEKKAAVLLAQADKMRAKATKTVAAQNMARRAERMLSWSGVRAGPRQGGQAALPRAGCRAARPRCGHPVCRGPMARRRSSPTSTSRSTADHGSWCSASTVPARRPCCGCSPASTPPTPGRSSRARAEGRLLRPGAREPRRRRGRCWRT
jgi:ATPase subunit of ABC transporter with duplicated ATPase domains